MYLKQVKHIACFISGTVDSAVSALLTKKRATNFITGLFLKDRFVDEQTLAKRRDRAFRTADCLQIPIQEICLTDAEWETFTRPVLSTYEHGMTPSIDVLYTRHILFGSLYSAAVHGLGVDYIAADHYARTIQEYRIDAWTPRIGNGLLRGLDQRADESYLLCQVSQRCLQKVYFPLGNLHREVTDLILHSSNLKQVFDDRHTDEPRHSVVLKEDVLKLVTKILPDTAGRVCENGSDIGQHQGLHLWHAGMEMSIDNRTYYVINKNPETHVVNVVSDKAHPALYSDTFYTSSIHWCYKTYLSTPGQTISVQLQIYPHTPPYHCTVTLLEPSQHSHANHVIVSCPQPIRALIPGHMVAFYSGEECIGSAEILRSSPMSRDAVTTSDYHQDISKVTNCLNHVLPPES